MTPNVVAERWNYRIRVADLRVCANKAADLACLVPTERHAKLVMKGFRHGAAMLCRGGVQDAWQVPRER